MPTYIKRKVKTNPDVGELVCNKPKLRRQKEEKARGSISFSSTQLIWGQPGIQQILSENKQKAKTMLVKAPKINQ